MPQPTDANRSAYLDLVKRSITNYLYLGGDGPFDAFRPVGHYDLQRAEWTIDPLSRPLTFLAPRQLDLIEQAMITIEQAGVPGDIIEAGVWRGGAVILMLALLRAYDMPDRTVVAADSFAGIPPNERARNDPVDQWPDRWVASLDEVKAAIARFGLLDERVEFVPGLFADSLKTLESRRFALIRLDSDSHDSVQTSLDHLYPLLWEGGFVIIDDWHLPGCRLAVTAYRARHGITDPIRQSGGNAYWVKQQPHGVPPIPGAD